MPGLSNHYCDYSLVATGTETQRVMFWFCVRITFVEKKSETVSCSFDSETKTNRLVYDDFVALIRIVGPFFWIYNQDIPKIQETIELEKLFYISVIICLNTCSYLFKFYERVQWRVMLVHENQQICRLGHNCHITVFLVTACNYQCLTSSLTFGLTGSFGCWLGSIGINPLFSPLITIDAT